MRFVWLAVGFIGFLTLCQTALAGDVVVVEAVADDQGQGWLCIGSGKVGHDELAQLISRELKIDGRITSIDVSDGNAKVGFRSTPDRLVAGRFAAEVVEANQLHQCAAAGLSGYRPAAAGGLLALGGIFGGLCWAGELGCGHSNAAAGPFPPVEPTPPIPPRPPQPPGPPPPNPPSPPVSPFN